MANDSIPLSPVLRIEPASACNLRCSHCPTGVFEMARTVMKQDVFRRVLEELRRNVPPIRVVVMYHGGEPFLNKNFLSMARRIKDVGVPFVKTVSNGMLIEPVLAEQIIDSGLDVIEISLDGQSGEQNNRVRRRSDWATVVGNVRHLAERVAARGSSLKILIATTQFLASDSNPKADPDVPNWLRDAFSGLESRVAFKSTWALKWPSQLPAEGYDTIEEGPPREAPEMCSLLQETLTVRADGRVVACCFDLTSMSNLGNILDQSLTEIWNGPGYKAFREDFARRNYPPLCRNCAVVTGRSFLVPAQEGTAISNHQLRDDSLAAGGQE